MADLYNFTNLTDGNTIVSIITFADEITQGWFITSIIIAIFFLFLIALISSKNDLKASFLAASFITLMCAVMLTAIASVNNLLLILLFVGTSGAFVAVVLSKQQ